MSLDHETMAAHHASGRWDALAGFRNAMIPRKGHHVPPSSLNGCVPCHVMSRVNGALLTGAYYPHPKQAMIAYSDEGPFAPMPNGDGWESLDHRTLIILEDEQWSAALQDEVFDV